jgi:hypothetical protein
MYLNQLHGLQSHIRWLMSDVWLHRMWQFVDRICHIVDAICELILKTSTLTALTAVVIEIEGHDIIRYASLISRN